MAAPKFTSRERRDVFRLIALLNSSLQFIIVRLEELSANKILGRRYIREMRVLTEEVQATLDKKIKRRGKIGPE
jgi:RNase P subunit RPR2